VSSGGDRRIPGLDGLRGVAVTMVLASHICTQLPWGGRFRNVLLRLLTVGWIGVDLFFVLSGYLITTLLLDRRHGRRPLLDFYARRALRILPLYFLVVGTIVIVSALAKDRPPEVEELLARQGWLWVNATNVVEALDDRWVFDTPWYGASHFWTLAVEEQFYLVWPLLVLFLGERSLLRLCAGLLGGCLLLRIGCLLLGVPTRSIYVLTPTRLDALAAGALVALVLRDPAARQRAVVHAQRIAAAGLLVLATIFVVRRGRLDREDAWVVTLGLSLTAWTFAALVAWVVAVPSGRLASLLEHRALVPIAPYSYGAYVVHWLVLPPLVRLSRTWASAWRADAVFVAAMLLATTALAVCLRHLWEQPFLRLKRYV
jgi:peptidoglycan/LPS O-acetylase OafA/YrhL